MSLGTPKIKVGDTIPDVTVHVGFAGNTPTAPQSPGLDAFEAVITSEDPVAQAVIAQDPIGLPNF